MVRSSKYGVLWLIPLVGLMMLGGVAFGLWKIFSASTPWPFPGMVNPPTLTSPAEILKHGDAVREATQALIAQPGDQAAHARLQQAIEALSASLRHAVPSGVPVQPPAVPSAIFDAWGPVALGVTIIALSIALGGFLLLALLAYLLTRKLKRHVCAAEGGALPGSPTR